MAERVNESLARRRFSMLLLTLFAILALGLAAIGTYGVIAYLVSQGTRELGIRMALGATPAGILLMIVRHGAILAGCSIALGLVGAFALTPLMRSLLFGVGPADPVTYTGIALLLALVALTATLVPASRAARIDEGHMLRPTCKVLTCACSRACVLTCFSCYVPTCGATCSPGTSHVGSTSHVARRT